MARSASAVAERAKYIKTDYICISEESGRPAPDTLDETLPFITLQSNVKLIISIEQDRVSSTESECKVIRRHKFF